MKRLTTVVLAAALCLLAVENVRGEGPRGGVGGGIRGASRPFVQGSKSGFGVGHIGAGHPFAGGSRWGGFGGFGGYGDPGLAGFGGFGFAGFGGGYGYGSSENTLLYRLGHIPVPPYYALHPPVYYGQRVFRTYGESPFADVSSSRGNRQPAASQMVINLAVPALSLGGQFPRADQTVAAEAPGTPSLAHSTGQMIFNPYYDGPPSEAEELVQTEGP